MKAYFNADGLNEEEVFQHRKKDRFHIKFTGATNLAKKY